MAAPHTSNWDFLYFVLFVWALEVRLSYLAKHTLFWWPQGVVLRWLGGIPVDRRAPHDLVERLTARFDADESFVLLIPPEGTRGNAGHWKSGFYRIARDAQIPIVAAALDWRTRTVRFTEALEVPDQPEPLMDRLRDFYRGVVGRHPDLTTPVRLRQEGAELG